MPAFLVQAKDADSHSVSGTGEKWSDLDQAFTLPQWIPLDSPWRVLYNQMLEHTRKECQNLQLLTVHILLIERYLTTYVCMRYREQHNFGTDEGFLSATVAKDVNAFWMTLAKEMNVMLAAARPPDRAAIGKAVKEVIADSIQFLETDDRRKVTQQLAAGLDRIGI